ncbi:aminopeptidase P family protein [bacterium]|nr:aminopeptidase P family protein [candidate division CSSED10-310 bacterium]
MQVVNMPETTIFPPPDEWIIRRRNLQSILLNLQIDVAWLAQAQDVFYFCGTAQNGHLLIFADDEPLLFIRSYAPRARCESKLNTVIPFRRMADIHAVIGSRREFQNRIPRVGIEMDVLPIKTWERLKQVLPVAEWVDLSPSIRALRACKSDTEIACIHQAAVCLDRVFDQIPGWLRKGMTELELTSRIESSLRQDGHQGFIPVRAFNSFIHYGNVLFGSNGAVRGPFDGPTCGPGLYPAIPKGSGWKHLEPGEPVFVDLVAGIGGYLADATRVFSLDFIPPNLENAHTACIDILEALANRIRPGVCCSDAYADALSMASDRHISEWFMGPPDDSAAFVGHGVGLEIDELPILAAGVSARLATGNIIAIEPKAVFPNEGAVGVENTYLITDSGAVPLTRFPLELHFVKSG